MASLLVLVFQMPRSFVVTRMIPGTAVGVLVGDLIYTFMAFRLARRTGRTDITAMPLGLDTPSTFGTVFLIIGPAYQAALQRGLDPDSSARHAWFLGITMLIASGLFKLACAPWSNWIRRQVPRAGLLGSLTAIALVLISFLPLLDIAAEPVPGLVAWGLMLATLTARWQFPRQFPGALGAVVAGCVVYYGLHLLGWGPGLGGDGLAPSASFRAVLPMPVDDWILWFARSGSEAIRYLPVAIPLALATVVGGIDCTESAAAAGDDYPTGQIIAAEGFATLAGGFFGGVIQSTPYIGHPAYKAMWGCAVGLYAGDGDFCRGSGDFRLFRLDLFSHSQGGDLPDLDLCWSRNHGSVVSCHAGAALSGGRFGVRARAGLPGAAHRKPAHARVGETVRRVEARCAALDSNGHRVVRRGWVYYHQPFMGVRTGAHDRFEPDACWS